MIINNIKLNKKYKVKRINFNEDSLQKFSVFGLVDNSEIIFIKKYLNVYIISINNNKFAINTSYIEGIELYE